MAKQIARLLKTDVMADIDLPAIAQFLQSQGRKGDSILAHINPKEAALLQDLGGASTPNPVTGLPEFYDPYASYDKPYSYETTQRKIVNTITAPEQQIVRAPRAELYAETVPDYTNSQTIDVPDYGMNRQRGFTSPVMQDAPTASQQARNSFATAFPSGEAMFTGAGDLSEPSYATRFTPNPFSDNLGLEMAARAARREVDKYSGEGSFTRDLPGTLNLAPVPENISRIPSEFATRPDLPEELAAVDNRNILRRGVDSLKEMTGLSGSELARLGLAGGLGLQGALAARDLKRQGEESRREQEAIAAPYRERGAALLAQAEQGELTPQGQQSLQAMRARLAQGAESRGGVGAQQAQAQIESYRQQLLANQYDYGMKISNVGDQLMMGAIRTGLEADRYATQMTNNYYTNMARLLVSIGADENDIKNITQSNNVGSQ